MGLIVLLVFWALVIRLWIMDGPKVPLIFIGIWVVGFFGLPLIGLAGYAFIAMQALLAVTLIIIERYNDIM